MLIWIILSKDWNGHKAGEKVQVAEADAKKLIADQTAADCPADQIPGADMAQQLAATINDAVGKALDGAVQKLKSWKPPAAPKDGDEELTGGFKNLGEFAMSVKNRQDGKSTDERIAKIMTVKTPSGMSEGVDSDGGILVPQEFSNRIYERVYAENNLLARCESLTISRSSIKFKRNAETSRANGSRWGGVYGYWLAEADQKQKSKPTFGTMELSPHKQAVFVVVTDELLEDADVALDGYLTRCAAAEINFRTSDSLISGTGAGMPLGILNAPCLTTVAKEAGQAADSIVSANVMKMWSRMFASSRANAIWMINQECEQQLQTMTVVVGVGGVPVYLPPSGLADRPYGILYSRPVVPVEWCSALGDVGDIILADWSQYLAVTRGAIKSAMSIHLRFDYDETAFRFVFRVDGQPWWASALTPYKGNALNTLSPFVTLQAR